MVYIEVGGNTSGGGRGLIQFKKKKFENLRGGWPDRSGKMHAFLTWLTKAFENRFAGMEPRVRSGQPQCNTQPKLGDSH